MKKLFLLLLTIASIALGVSAKTRSVQGTVVYAGDNEPLAGATILPVGGGNGVSTDLDGKFTLKVPADCKHLVVSYVGMITRQVDITDGDMLVKLTNSENNLDEVMVVAYGTAKKSSFTGSAESVSGAKIAERPIANVTKALDGQVAGVQTSLGSGQPGSGAGVVIRGYGSMSASSSPLYVVDGIPYDGAISAINPNDIETLTVLKDAAAGALYGSRGANGVVMITTKKGVEGKAKVNFKANWGIASRAIPRYETMDERGYVETVYQSYKNNQIYNNGLSPQAAAVAAIADLSTGATKIFGENEQYNPFNIPAAELIDPATGKVRADAQLRYDEDWLDEVMRDNPLRQEYQIQVSGGTNRTNYMFSLGYLKEEGLLKTTEFNRYSGRMDINTQVTKWFRSGLNANYSRNESNSAQENNSYSSNVWYTAQLMPPIYPVFEKNIDGTNVLDNLGQPVFDYGANRPAGANANWNCIATLYDDKYSSTSDNFSGRAFAEIGNLQTGPLQGLKLTINYGMDLQNSQGMTYYNPDNGNAVNVDGRITKQTGRMFSYTLNQLLSYDRTFGKHHVNALVGHEFYKMNYQYLGAQKTGFPFAGLYELDAATTITAASSYTDNYAIESVLSNIGYDYDDKYYVSASIRTDGSSRFNKDNRWGTFWSVGGNYRISKEKFMEGLDWLDNLSIRASYGVQGNDRLLDGSGYDIYYAWQSFYDLGYPNAALSGAVVTSLENPELRWEKNKNVNVGIEARVFNRLNVTAEWYKRTTSDMLMSYPMASSLGFDGYSKNIGSMYNTGFDITLRGDVIKTRDFSWVMTLMGSTVKNKVTKLADKPEIIGSSTIIREGEPLNSFYTATSAGVDPATGSQLYWVWDEDENGVQGERYVTDDMSKAQQCRSIQGNRMPDLYGSIGNEFRYKDFDLSFLFTYSIGGKILDGVYNTLLYGNYVGNAKSAHLERAWKQPGDITDIPRIEIGKNYILTDASLINASYFALKNITFGYTMPSKLLKAIDLQSVRFSVTADNVFILNHLKGMNNQYNFTGGTNFGYTPTRMVSLGVDVTF